MALNRPHAMPLIGGPSGIPEIGQRLVFITGKVGTIEVTEPGTWPANRNGRA